MKKVTDFLKRLGLGYFLRERTTTAKTPVAFVGLEGVQHQLGAHLWQRARDDIRLQFRRYALQLLIHQSPGMPEQDAVCFTAGAKGAPFAAGVIHAHMAANRPQPAVAAGISMGAVSAAALQRCYRELAAAEGKSALEVEAAHWHWLRDYLATLTDRPADVYYDSIPNPTDFFADSSAPQLRDRSVPKGMEVDEMRFNRQRYLLTNLGTWLAKSPVRVSTLSTAIVRYVRWQEEYSGNKVTRLLLLVGTGLRLLWQVLRLAAFHPTPVNEGTLDGTLTMPRPLIGWGAFLAAWAFILSLLAPVAAFVAWCYGVWPLHGSMLVATLLPLVLLLFAATKRPEVRHFFLAHTLASVGFQRSLLHNFPLRERLQKLFGDAWVGQDPFPVLIVAAPLEVLLKDKQPAPVRQLWANPHLDRETAVRVVDALTAALAQPGLWPPYCVETEDLEQWAPVVAGDLPKDPKRPPGTDNLVGSIHLVDGSTVRHNPLPALLKYLQSDAGRDTACALERRDNGEFPPNPRPSIHVVYAVPIAGPDGDGRLAEERANMVDVAQAALELEARRDTRVEVQQVNFITRLAIEVHRGKGPPDLNNKDGRLDKNEDKLVMAMADEIAPAAEDRSRAVDDSANPLQPEREQALTKVAEGCRRALQKFYGAQLQQMQPVAPAQTIPCGQLLRAIAPQRHWQGAPAPGLPEVCEHCTQQLERPQAAPAPCAPSSLIQILSKVWYRYVWDAPAPHAPSSFIQIFPNLRLQRETNRQPVAQPRVAFVWSGGVFRGAFHIGMIGALLRANIRPDLIASASVGTLMGGALASMFSFPRPDQPGDPDPAFDRLRRLVDVFLCVDEEVALTRTLKEASRDLSIRGRQIHLSAARVRRTVRRGTKSNAGYAATGAPPELIDAISELFSIPLEETRAIASKFVAGQVADATHEMLRKLKKHTLARLNIETAVIGASLLKIRAKELICGSNVDLTQTQPFRQGGIAFLATATNLGAQAPVVLGGEQPSARPYSFIHAALSSSAFPAVFAPRRDSEVFPGTGCFDIRYSDGGMFDNLPFVPVIEALASVQRAEGANFTAAQSRQYLIDRRDNPDLLLAGALDAKPEEAKNAAGPFGYFNEIAARASSLARNSKIRTFAAAAGHVHKLFQQLAGLPRNAVADPEFLQSAVHAAVLPVFPTDAEHLNGTFAFCKCTGLKVARVQLSIADGCYQTLETLADSVHRSAKTAPASGYSSNSDSVLRSVTRLQEVGRVPKIEPIKAPDRKDGTTCPFFRLNGEYFECPFVRAQRQEIRARCAADLKHDPEHH